MTFFLIFHSQLAINYTKQLKKIYFLMHLHKFVYKTKIANVAIKSDILGFLVERAVVGYNTEIVGTLDNDSDSYDVNGGCQLNNVRLFLSI